VALLAIAFCGCCVLAFWRLSRSHWGSAMRAVKDSEIAAESIGLNPVAIKALAFALSAACAGLAGALFAPLSGFVTPSTFAFLQSILFVLVVIVGGAGTLSGPLVGAAIVVLLPELLAGLAEYRLLFFGALMLACSGLAPEGIVGGAEMDASEKGFRFSRGKKTFRENPKPSLQVPDLTIAFGGVKAATDVASPRARAR
jgi:ABC-type branched-subunit amino acid transport system permease subunit